MPRLSPRPGVPPVSSFDDSELRDFLATLATVAARETLPRFRAGIAVDNKAAGSAFDPVTEADRAAEAALRRAITARFPDHGIQGEEAADKPATSPYTWILDPVDGTRSFVCGMPTWGTLVGLLADGAPYYGMMSQPFVGERFVGGGGRAELVRADGTRVLACRTDRTLATATLFATTPEMFAPGPEAAAFAALSARVQLTRFGADCYGYALLAAGFVDLVVEANLGYYDIAPVIPIVEAAGGVVSDWSGRPVRGGGRAVAAASPALLEAALDILAGAP
ncbi:MAG: histidinol-phosphatase [Gammaproteobacteria bacterium]|nr:histidinol-phosphatase [Gammaproteobacteria bacterium]